jgi:hypothetical protein
MTQPAPNPAGSAPRFGGLYRTLGVSLVLPLIVIQVLLHRGVPPVYALAAATIFPLGEMVYEAVTSKRIGLIAIVSFTGIVVGFGLSFATGNAIYALLKDSLFTTVFGLLFLGSLLTPRPLIYRLSLDFAGTSPEARAAAEDVWSRPGAPRVFRLITLVWGVGLVFEAAVRVVAALTLPIATATAASPIIAVVCIGGILVWTVGYVRYVRRVRAGAGAAAG